MSWYYYDDRFDLMDPPKALSLVPHLRGPLFVSYYPVPLKQNGRIGHL